MTHPYAHLPTEFAGCWYGDSPQTPAEKFTYFLQKFGAPSDAQEYHPLLLVNNSSCSGEIAQSFGLFVKDGALFEVTGTECSVWDFDGQWEPEQTSTAELLHRLDKGTLGTVGDEDSQFSEPLRAILEWIDSALQKHVLLDVVPQGSCKTPKKI